MTPLFDSAIVRRADLSDAVGALELRSPGESIVVLIGAGRGVRGVGLVTPDARRAAWGTRLPHGITRSRIPHLLEGGRVIGASERGVEIEKGGEHRVVSLEGARVVVREGTLPMLVDASQRPLFEARGQELLVALGDEARERWRDQAARAIERGMTRIERRISAMRGDLARLADAETIAAQAQWLVAEAARAPRGARSLTVTDWSSGEPRTLEVPLDPSKPARAQVEAMFQRARRLKRGAKIAEERIAKAEATKAILERALEDVRTADSSEAIDVSLEKARATAPKEVALDATQSASPGARASRQPKSPPFRTFASPAGARILVGKGAAQNDELTFQTARPHDLWLHAKGRTGAHVIVPLAKNTSCPAELLIDAAHLAAHFSDARGEAIVDVQYTARRYLRKPRGSPPGFVVVEREKVLPVRLEPGRVERLLEREE